MEIFSYKMDHDFGLAPNPFWGVMTLAVCKGAIRRNSSLHIGDWVIGSGSESIKHIDQLIFAMKVEKRITFDEYWDDPKYECKRPVINGSLLQMYGDNFYHTLKNGTIVQEPSAHSKEGFLENEYHKTRDAINGKFVLLSKTFYYFGDWAIDVPERFRPVFSHSRNYEYIRHRQLNENFVNWLTGSYQPGIYGDPINWSKDYNLNKF